MAPSLLFRYSPNIVALRYNLASFPRRTPNIVALRYNLAPVPRYSPNIVALRYNPCGFYVLTTANILL